jgi:hypothetical protein
MVPKRLIIDTTWTQFSGQAITSLNAYISLLSSCKYRTIQIKQIAKENCVRRESKVLSSCEQSKQEGIKFKLDKNPPIHVYVVKILFVYLSFCP